MKQFPDTNKLQFKKYHKVNKSFLFLLERKRFYPFFGLYGLKAMEAGKLKFKHIEACRKTLKRGLRKKGALWIRVFTWAPVTKKSVGLRMGKGKGGIAYWIAPIKKGQIIFEINGVNLFKSISILRKALTKLPIKVSIVKVKY